MDSGAKKQLQRTLGIYMIGFLGLVGLLLAIGTSLQGELSADAKFIGGCIFIHQFWTAWASENTR